MTGPVSAAAAGTIEIGGDMVVRRLGFGAMAGHRQRHLG